MSHDKKRLISPVSLRELFQFDLLIFQSTGMQISILITGREMERKEETVIEPTNKMHDRDIYISVNIAIISVTRYSGMFIYNARRLCAR